MKPRLKGHLSMLSANVTWGLMAPFSKYVILGGVVTPIMITNMRFGGAMALFWLLSCFTKHEPVPKGDMLRLLGAAMLGVCINQTCFMLGVGLTAPSDASIITTTMPMWVMVLSAIILKDPITTRKVGGIACGATGALLLILGSSRMAGASGAKPVLGDAMVLTAQLSYALYLTLYKNFVAKYSLVTLMKWMFTFAFIVNLPLSLPSMVQAPWSQLGWLSAGALAFTVVLGTFVAYIFITIGQKTLPPTVVGMYNYVQPVVACLVGISLGLDAFNLEKALAIILIFTGVWLVTRQESRAN